MPNRGRRCARLLRNVYHSVSILVSPPSLASRRALLRGRRPADDVFAAPARRGRGVGAWRAAAYRRGREGSERMGRESLVYDDEARHAGRALMRFVARCGRCRRPDGRVWSPGRTHGPLRGGHDAPGCRAAGSVLGRPVSLGLSLSACSCRSLPRSALRADRRQNTKLMSAGVV